MSHTGKKNLFLKFIFSVSFLQRIYCLSIFSSFFCIILLEYCSRCHLCEVAAVNSVLQLKSFVFFLFFFPSSLPSHPSSGSQGQFPLTQNVTVVEGGTANLTCRVDQNDNTSLQWSNPAQQTLYFDDKKGKYFQNSWFCSIFSKTELF